MFWKSSLHFHISINCTKQEAFLYYIHEEMTKICHICSACITCWHSTYSNFRSSTNYLSFPNCTPILQSSIATVTWITPRHFWFTQTGFASSPTNHLIISCQSCFDPQGVTWLGPLSHSQVLKFKVFNPLGFQLASYFVLGVMRGHAARPASQSFNPGWAAMDLNLTTFFSTIFSTH